MNDIMNTMGYDLRQRLTGPHDSWIAVDEASGREVLAHRMNDPASQDILTLVMQIRLGQNEAARPSVLDFVEQDGAWLLVTEDSPSHREIRQWLEAGGASKAAAPAVDPHTLTRMFRSAEPKPVMQRFDSSSPFTPPEEE